MRVVEYEYGLNCLLIGKVERRLSGSLELKEFSVIVYISDMDHDVTESISAEFLKLYKERFLEHVEEKYYVECEKEYDNDEEAIA